MKDILESLKLYWLSFLFLKEKRKREELAIAHRSLREGSSFDIPEKEHTDPLIPLKVALRLIKNGILKKGKASDFCMRDERGFEPIAVLDSNKNGASKRFDHVHFFSDQRPGLLVSRKGIETQGNIFEKGFFVLILLFFQSILLFHRYRKGNKALVLKEWIQGIFIYRTLFKARVNVVHMYCIYEKDKNLLAYWLQKHGIQVNKITADPPLAFYNQRVLSDSLALCHPYQKEEVEYFGDSIIADNVQIWGPERVLEYIGDIEKKEGAVYRLGFYSNAVWLRKEEGHRDPGFGNFLAEDRLLEFLRDWIEERNEILRIYLHPKEKSDQRTFERAKEFYKGLFGDLISICSSTERSAYFFPETELGVGGFSGSLMERLFAGYKVLFFASPLKGFPLKGSPMETLAPPIEGDFQDRMQHLLSKGEEELFQGRLGEYVCSDMIKEKANAFNRGEA